MKKLLIFTLAISLISATAYAGWKSAVLGGAVGYVVGSAGNKNTDCTMSYNSGKSIGKTEAINGLRNLIITSDKKKYTKEELLALLSE